MLKELIKRLIPAGIYKGRKMPFFESNYAQYIGTKYAVGCADGLES